MRLSREDFSRIIALTPLVSMDLLVTRPDGHMLVGWRTNRPAQHHWFAPGGRILKGETRAEAFARLTETELGARFELSECPLAEVYEHLYDDNTFGDADYGTHYVVLAHLVRVDERFVPKADDQHTEWRWISRDELVNDPAVHHYTRNYGRNI
jgi:colanic acid biosynthesis protein WcaH